MSQNFARYSELGATVIRTADRLSDSLERKREIIDEFIGAQGRPKSVLCLGFSPLIMVLPPTDLTVAYATDEIKKFLDSRAVKYSCIDAIGTDSQKFDWVIATDEYFTFATDETVQNLQIALVCGLARNLVITTLKDYKNQDSRDREFSQPVAVHNNSGSTIFLEHHQYSIDDRNSWQTEVWQLQADTSVYHGQFARRSMFFKQLAKFAIDAGATKFTVHKNLMYKGMMKKNYEHVISITFD